MACHVCKSIDSDLRMGVCFDCATEGDLRLWRRSTFQHWLHGIRRAFRLDWLMARIDFKCGWERIWRTGEYAPGREWEEL